MFSFLLHWYLVFSIVWNIQSRDTFAKNSVQSFTVSITYNDKIKQDKTYFLNRYGDFTSIHSHVNDRADKVDTFIYAYALEGKILSVGYRDVTYVYNWNQNQLIGKEEYMGQSLNIVTRKTDYILRNNSVSTQSSMLDDALILTTTDTFNHDTRQITENHFSGHDFYGKTVYSLDSSNKIIYMEISHPGSIGVELHKYNYNEKGLLLVDSVFLPNKPKPEIRTYEYSYF